MFDSANVYWVVSCSLQLKIEHKSQAISKRLFLLLGNLVPSRLWSILLTLYHKARWYDSVHKYSYKVQCGSSEDERFIFLEHQIEQVAPKMSCLNLVLKDEKGFGKEKGIREWGKPDLFIGYLSNASARLYLPRLLPCVGRVNESVGLDYQSRSSHWVREVCSSGTSNQVGRDHGGTVQSWIKEDTWERDRRE